MNPYHLIFILLTSCVCISCRPVEDENNHNNITFYNGTGTALYIAQDTKYPDTTITDLGVLNQPKIYKVEAYSFNYEALSLHPHDTYEMTFKGYKGNKIIPSDTLMVFVFDAEKLEKRDSHVKYSLLVRYDLSLKDLQKNNWTLTYPPTESMKTIKMWPKIR